MASFSASEKPPASRQSAGIGAPRIRPYKDFLTPMLHRSFTNAALIGLAMSWINAISMSKLSFFWSWFPLGIAGLRTGLLFVSCLTIFILRVAYLHIGRRTYSSSFTALFETMMNKRTIWTVIWYWTSAFLFSEVYMHSTGAAANLGWVDSGRSYERPRLNERAVLFRNLFGILAVVQASLHIGRDADALIIPTKSKVASARPGHTEGDISMPDPPIAPLRQLWASAPTILVRTAALTIEVAVFGPFVYFLLLRNTAWSIALRVAKLFHRVQNSQTPIGLTDVFALFARFIFAASLLVLLWEVTNKTFTIFAELPPLKKGQPLTNDSPHPNASLVNGLKAKKEIPHTLALWELKLIAEGFEDRRRTIYNDFEKPGASTWLDVLEACLVEIQSVSSSIRTTLFPAPAPAVSTASQPAQAPKARITQPLQDNPQIFSPSRKPTSALDAIADGVGSIAKSIGQSPNNNRITDNARLLMDGKTSATQGTPPLTTSSVSTRIKSFVLDFLRTPLGMPFRISFQNQVDRIVFGHPYSNAVNIHHAVQALCRLTVCSLKEDNFGQVQKDVGRIVRVLSRAIQDVLSLQGQLKPHWTDVYFREEDRRTPELDELLVTLRDGLEMVVLSFGEYAGALGITPSEMRRAKELVGKGNGTEMIKR